MQTEIRKASFGLFFVSGILLFIVFALVAWLFFRLSTKADAYDDQRAQERIKKLGEYRKAEADKLQGVSWVDQAKGVAKVPIDQAMRGVVLELKEKKVKASGVKVDEPYPYGLAAPKPAQPAPAAAPKAADAVSKQPAPSDSPAAKQSVNGTTLPSENDVPISRPASPNRAVPSNAAPPNPAPTSTPASSATPSYSAAPTPAATASPTASPAQP